MKYVNGTTYIAPPLEVFEDVESFIDTEKDNRAWKVKTIIDKLAIFGIKLEFVKATVGPTYTEFQFDVLENKSQDQSIRNYFHEIKFYLGIHEDIFIVESPDGKSVAMQIPNKARRTVKMRSILESKEFRQSSAKLTFPIGEAADGTIVVGDLAQMPHLLVAGTTGSGKSIFLRVLILGMMYKYSPDYVRFIMVDPKLVELSSFNGVPHMLINKSLTNCESALASLDYLNEEMESRYKLFAAKGVYNLAEYNEAAAKDGSECLPYLVWVADEFSDMMCYAPEQTESRLVHLMQKSRPAGIHIVLATQRPDADILTKTLMDNISARIALKLSSQQESKNVIACGGAEKLCGRGDLLFVAPGLSHPLRAQNAYIFNDEFEKFIRFSKEKNECCFDVDAEISISLFEMKNEIQAEEYKENVENIDPYCKKALRFWLEEHNGLASMASAQRALKIGFNRAGRIMDQLQRLGYVEEPDFSDSEARSLKVLVKLEDLDRLFPDMADDEKEKSGSSFGGGATADEKKAEEKTQAVTASQTETTDPYCKKALRFWLEEHNGLASVASAQRALKIGFNRAARILEQLQRLGYVDDALVEKYHYCYKVLVKLEDLDRLFPDMAD